jgi:hypothetical protein
MRGRITPRVCDKTAMLPTYIMTHIVTMHIIHSNLIYHSEWYIYINPFTFERLPHFNDFVRPLDRNIIHKRHDQGITGKDTNQPRYDGLQKGGN